MFCSVVLVSAVQKMIRPFTHICALPLGFLSCPGQHRASGVFSPDIYSTHSTRVYTIGLQLPTPPPSPWASIYLAFPGGSDGRESACKAGDLGSIDPLEEGTATHSSILGASLVVSSLPLSLSLLCK